RDARRRTTPRVRDGGGTPPPAARGERVAPSPSAHPGGRYRKKYQGPATAPPSHPPKITKKNGRSARIAIRASARIPPVYRITSGGAPSTWEIQNRNGTSTAAINRRPSRHFHRIERRLTAGSLRVDTRGPP